ncbi:MAG TPA: helix-turn-helix domain-containing protein [Mycobacteriales bacterium]|nr:helix-turn-helix domain-containing protein [Mycobacteriales bacterium]
MDHDSQHITVADLPDLAVITIEQAAGLLRLGRSSAYEAARRGELPTIRIGRRLLVPAPRLLAMLADESSPRVA